MAERSIALAHTTILRWVQRYVPDFEKRSNQYARAVGDSWRVDETQPVMNSLPFRLILTLNSGIHILPLTNGWLTFNILEALTS